MKFTRVSTQYSNGTGLAGYVYCSYDKLVEVFGLSSGDLLDDWKTDVTWVLLFADGTVATIYNYKDGPNYNRDGGTPVEDITQWHVGGHDRVALTRVAEALGVQGETPDAYVKRIFS